jgi:hypothetical protein
MHFSALTLCAITDNGEAAVQEARKSRNHKRENRYEAGERECASGFLFGSLVCIFVHRTMSMYSENALLNADGAVRPF